MRTIPSETGNGTPSNNCFNHVVPLVKLRKWRQVDEMT